MKINETALGPNHPNVATDVHNLGLVLKAQGDLAGAKAAYERALNIDIAVFGLYHPKVATVVNNLGVVLKAQGIWQERKPPLSTPYGYCNNFCQKDIRI